MATARPEVRRRQGSKHDKTGCLTCRFRRKKCTQNTFPVCGTCARLNLECVRQPVRSIVPATGAQATPTSPDEPQRLQLSLPVAPSSPSWDGPTRDAGAQRRHAMRYYITVLTQHVTVSEQYNSFLSAFLPMAMESKALADSLVAWASSHLALTDQSYELLSLESHSSAVRALSSSLVTHNDDLALHETNASACLALLISEVCQGDRQIWYSHLLGAKSIIESARSGDLRGVDAFKLTSEGQWVLRNFAYHDVLASVTLSQPPLLDGSYLEGITNVVDSCVGVASGILKIIADICALDHRLRSEGLDHHDGRTSFIQLETQLRDWEFPPDTTQNLAAVGQAYRCAAQIVLYRAWRQLLPEELDQSPGHDETSRQIGVDEAVTVLLESIANIPQQSIAEGPLVFPLFLAGGETMAPAQQQIIRTRLQASFEFRRFQNISRALEILETLWERRKTDSNLDWKDVLAESGGGLILT
ncbi:uncharacterized protein HMPREF1541_03592 [Cyphellophora europaea CBS 101466]|uniref:Zn(2)-C6 fungal-type domain-containing protein n=1 Tax=Cyphellophora europaea (strain CBS 101466) TaxID=1220924 RepID=W2RYS2_CYPE1|nr:uncharacterized protein HMPREF1541_03592 [Cyphellophora europaea CBS 101466]ETN41656.1 hypothetical protein HMPREF1541_03592 [Cyphellophora europaea CBS 101466]